VWSELSNSPLHRKECDVMCRTQQMRTKRSKCSNRARWKCLRQPRHWRKSKWIGDKIDHKLVNQIYCDHLRILSRTRQSQTFKNEGNDFIYLYRAMTLLSRHPPELSNTKNRTQYARLWETERSVDPSHILTIVQHACTRRKFPGRFVW
jgi:hypothetical protein